MLITFLLGPWTSLYFAGNTLDFFALLLCAALGAAVCFRAGLFNMGLDAQIYAGSVAASAVMLNFPNGFAPLILCLACLAALTTGFLMGGLCGFLKKITGANEVITTFLLSGAVSPVADYIINTFLREPSGNLISSRHFPENFMLYRFFDISTLSVSFIFVIMLPFLAQIFLYSTKSGYAFRIAGSAPAFARYGGINPENYWIPALGASGALGGLCGFFAMTGTYGQCYQGWTGGLGWAAITVALLAENKMLPLIPAAIFYTQLKRGTDSVLLESAIRFESSGLIQAIVLLVATVKIKRRF
ncbi:MAG: ABC transporter permease [Termitinemataceae bacterium]|nr:MAG: ABC transporter permease [Termitinemataceae bacterium]